MRYNARMFEPAKPAEAHFRHGMRGVSCARRCGHAKTAPKESRVTTKRIGHLGGLASVKTRRDRNAATLSEETPPQPLTRDSAALAIPEPAEDRTARCDEALPEAPADSKIDTHRLAEMIAVALAEFDPPT